METWLQKGCRFHKEWKHLITQGCCGWSLWIAPVTEKCTRGSARIKPRLQSKNQNPKSQSSSAFKVWGGGQAESQFQCEKEETEQKGVTFRWQDQRNLQGKMHCTLKMGCTSVPMVASPTPPFPSPGMFLDTQPCPFPWAAFNPVWFLSKTIPLS